MDKTLLVMVFVPTTDAADTDHHGRQGQIGTGYPVGPDLILTARHLLDPAPPERRDTRYPIKVRWHSYRMHPQAGPDGWVAIPDAAVICPECEALDAMLLRCPRPDGAIGWGILSEEAPTDQMQWSSEGFPDAGDYEGLRHPCSFGGTCFSKAPTEDYFELVAAGPPEGEGDWRGASGMPIFVGRRILGVAQQVPRRFGAARLHATPCWKLAADQRFRDALGLDERKVRVTKARHALVKLLTAHPSALAALAEVLDDETDLTGVTDPRDRADRVVTRLLETDLRCAIPALRRAHLALLSEVGAQEADPLVSVACTVVPALFDQGVVLHTKGLMYSPVLVPVPAGTRTVAELIMAGVDGRAARFRPRVDENHQPSGELSLPLHAEQGIAGNAGVALAAHLERKFDPGRTAVEQPGTPLRTLVDDYLLTEFRRSEPGGPVRDQAQRIQLAADLLEARARDRGWTYYMVFSPPEDTGERQAIEALVEELKRDYKAIAFLGLDPAFSQERADHQLVDPLCFMLPLKA